MTREVRDRHVVQVGEEVHLLGFGCEAGPLTKPGQHVECHEPVGVTTSGSAARRSRLSGSPMAS